MQNSTDQMQFEIRRKLFHLCALFFPILYIFIAEALMSKILFFTMIIVVFSDIYRRHNLAFKELFENIFSPLLRESEKNNNIAYSGASYMMSGFFITSLFFPKGLVISSWLVLIFADCVAAIIGMVYGKPLANGKSVEGSVAFFVTALLVSIFSYFFVPYHTSFMTIFFSSGLTCLVEFYSNQTKINDNLSIPISYCLFTTAINLMR